MSLYSNRFILYSIYWLYMICTYDMYISKYTYNIRRIAVYTTSRAICIVYRHQVYRPALSGQRNGRQLFRHTHLHRETSRHTAYSCPICTYTAYPCPAYRCSVCSCPIYPYTTSRRRCPHFFYHCLRWSGWDGGWEWEWACDEETGSWESYFLYCYFLCY